MTGHGDPWDYIDGLREDLGRAEEHTREVEDALKVATGRIAVLERDVRRLWTHVGNMPGGV